MIYSNGATINNNGFAIGIAQPFQSPLGEAINSIASFHRRNRLYRSAIVTIVPDAAARPGGAPRRLRKSSASGFVTNVLITCRA